MSPALRSRLAMLVLFGSFLIPLSTSSLGGLTHVVTCRERTRTPFSVVMPLGERPELTSSTRIERGQKPTLCGGLEVNPKVAARGRDRVAMTIPITNHSDSVWRGTVQLRVNKTSIPVGIGEVDAGDTRATIVTLKLPRGTNELSGSLLIGP